MKVALVSIIFNTKSGSERRTYQLAKGLLEAGHEVEVFAARVEDMDLGAKVNIVPMSAGPSFVKVKSFTSNVNRMLSGRPDIDVVHNQIRPFTDGIVTVGGGCHADYLERMGRGLSLFNPLHRLILGMERKRYREGGCKAVITNSNLAREGILRHYPIPPDRVFVAYNGVDLAKFHPAIVSGKRVEIRNRYGLDDGPVALFLGSGFGRKGLSTLIKALPVVTGMDQDIKNLKVLVVGKDDPASYIKLAKRLNVADRLVFAGQTNEPEYFYGAADIFVLPTKYDPFSNATLEAMACGLPVITTAMNGVSEIITDGEDGFVLKDADDHNGLAASLAYLSCEKARKQTGAGARLKAEGLTWEKTLGTTLDIYGKVRG